MSAQKRPSPEVAAAESESPSKRVRLSDEDAAIVQPGDEDVDDEEVEQSIRPEEEVADMTIPSSSTNKPKEEETERSLNLDGANDDLPPSMRADTDANEQIELSIPQKKDATLREFLSRMDESGPIIPDAVTNHYLTLAGLPPPPQTSPHLARLLALATQKFIADIAADAYQYARIRASHTTSNTGGAAMANLGLPGQAAGLPGGPPNQKDEKKAAGQGGLLGQPRPGFGGGGGGGGAGGPGGGPGGVGAAGAPGGGQGRTVLTMEDLGMAVGEFGVNVRRGEFYR